MAKCPYCKKELQLADYVMEKEMKISPPQPFGKADTRPIKCAHCDTLLGFS